MTTKKSSLWKDTKCVSIAFSVFVIMVVIILLAILNLALSPVIQESVKFNNQYMSDNPTKFLPEVRQNQNDAYRFFDAFSVITLITLFSWAVVNAIKRNQDEIGG